METKHYSKNPKITVFGAGSFGTTMAHLLKNKGYDVLIWARDTKLADEINQSRTNSKYLGSTKLSAFAATTDIKTALNDRDIFLFAIPCQFIRSFLTKINDQIPDKGILVNLAKGIEMDTLKRPSEIFAEILGKKFLDRYAMVSGPTFAEELLKQMPSGAAIACQSEQTAKYIQEVISTRFFRLYIAHDIIGVELGGALKNVMAIGVGIVDGLGYGLNARAGNMTRCLHEMTELGIAMGAKERTFSGLSGIGDLMLTCTGDLSRNRQVGLRLGKGEKIESILKSMNQVAEGVPTAKSVYELNQKYQVQMPNAEHVYKILYENMSPKNAVDIILSRELKTEY